MNVTANIVCYKSKTLSNGEHPLMIRICKNGKKKYKSLGFSTDIRYLRIYCNGEKDREAEDYQAQPPITTAYKGVLPADKAVRNQCPYLGKSERDYLHSSENQHHS